MTFTLTDNQQVAMDMVAAFMKAPTPIPAVLTGFAGTGKTTIIRTICQTYGEPVILAPTGKAALRVKEATGFDAQTIHSWLYHPKEDEKSGEVKFQNRKAESISTTSNNLVIVDEASMVTRDLWERIWDVCQILGMRVLMVGDPFQLAPVEMNKDPSTKPFSCLTEIVTPFTAHLSQVTRQALDSPVLRASMLVRESNRIDEPLRLLTRVFSKQFDQKCMEMHQSGGVVIVHRNVTRHRVNQVVRAQLNYGEAVMAGEPLLVTRNNYGVNRFNGEVLRLDQWITPAKDSMVVRDNYKNISRALSFGHAKVEGSEVMLCQEEIHGQAADMTETVIRRYSGRFYEDHLNGEEAGFSNEKKYKGPPHLHANLGYALSAHKSQGSEWDNVLVLIENSVKATTYEGRRWLYTALTRAKQNCFFTMEA